MLKGSVPHSHAAARALRRAPPVILCTTTAEPPRRTQLPSTSFDARQQPRFASGAQGPGAPFGAARPRRAAPQQGPGSAQAPAAARGQPGQAPEQDPTRGRRLPEVNFLEDTPSVAASLSTTMYEKYMADGSGSILVRSLGRMGAAGALRFLRVLREKAAKAPQPRDIRVRLGLADPIPGFGVVQMMFVETIPGPVALPSDEEMGKNPELILTVSGRTERERLELRLHSLLQDLPPRTFIRMDMLGLDNIYRGLRSLTGARARFERGGRSIFFVPEFCMSRRRPFPSKQQQQQGQTEQQQLEEQEQQQDQEQAAAAPSDGAEAEMVEVLRMYISRSLPPRVAGARQPAPEARQQAASAEGAAAAITGSDGTILVSAAEWETLKGTLGAMVEQQKALKALLEEQRAASAAGAAGAGAGSPPASA